MATSERMTEDREEQTESSSQSDTWLSVGLAVGVSLGVTFDNIGVGVGLGVAFGIIFGSMLDARANSQKAGEDPDTSPGAPGPPGPPGPPENARDTTAEARDGIEGLEPKELFRAALGRASDDPDAVRKAAEEEERVRIEIGQRLPDLQLLELLGRGGMGYVFRAHQRRLDRDVALKVVAPVAGAQAEFAERFAREAQALARLNHPNIVAVHDFGQDGDFCWIVMEYVDGSNLRDVIRAGKLQPAEALALVPKICDALQFAHDQGVVHRDVKPENILLDREGKLKIADFGLAKLTGTTAALVSLTGSQQVLGTFRYMAPEQLDRPLEVDHRADIYSLGVVFYEMLTGEIPMGRFDPPSRRSDASPQLDDVVLRALEKEPDRRYQQATDVKSDLAALGRTERPSRGATDPGPTGPTDGRFAPELSMRAVMSSVVFGLGVPPSLFAIIFLVAGLRESGPTSESIDASASASGPFSVSMADIVALAAGVLGLALMIIASTQGFRALAGIRRAWPRFYGAGSAVVGAWGGILLVVNLFVLTLIFEIHDDPAQLSPKALVLALLVFFATDVSFLVLLRGLFLKRCRLESPAPARS